MLFSRWVAFSALAFFIMIITARKVSKTQWSTDASFYCIATDAILDEIAIFKNVTNNIIDCIDFCISVAVCKAINTHKRTDGKLDCHLLQKDHMTSNKVISKPGWRLYDTGSSDTNSAIGSKCSTKPSNPCSVGCACVDTTEGHRCDCDNVTKTVFPSCKAALHQNNMAELYYFIKRGDMAEAVYVNCTKNSEGSYVAIFDHKNEKSTLVNGYEPCGSYMKSLDYSPNNITDIAAYIETAASCRQFTKLECRGTLLMRETDCGHPYSRSGVRLNYWGGGPTDGIGCACGITNSCYNTGFKCNCDANAAAELVDEGYMTDKAVLPITEVRFGDTEQSSPQVGWTTVFLTEYAGPLCIYLLFYARPSIIYGHAASSQPMDRVVHIACACWSFHYAKRLYETIFVHRFSHSTMPIRNIFKNSAYYWGFAGLIAYFVNHPLYTPPSFGQLQINASLIGFFLCEYGNFVIHRLLRDLRPAGSKERKIPYPTNNPFSWLFKLVSCPNYTYEVGAWISFTVLTQTLTAGIFTLAGFAQMAIWAKGKHGQYKKEFKDYPRRKAILPFLL